jgi:hypothetical protein
MVLGTVACNEVIPCFLNGNPVSKRLMREYPVGKIVKFVLYC